MGKMIEAYPKPGKICRTEAVWQWDHGDTVHLNDIDLPSSYKAEFSNVPVRGTAKSMVLTGDSFEIPYEYQESGEPIYIWIVYVDSTSRQTELFIVTPVNARSRPTDESFEPEEQTEVEQVMSALNSGVELVQEIADGIPQAIDNALAEAKASGEFDGPPGPKGDTGGKGEKGDTGAQGPQGPKGDSYILTDADKEEIITQVAEQVNAPVTDVKVDGTSVLTNGIANIPVASGSNLGVTKVTSNWGLRMSNNEIKVQPATSENVKYGAHNYNPLTPAVQNASAFYGLAKAAGSDEKSSILPVGQYSDSARSAIQVMLGIAGIVGSVEGAIASKAYAVDDMFLYGGFLYKVTSSITRGEAIVPGTNCEKTTIIDILKGA